ncbi:hypothetical protein [Pseudomonas sp. W5-36]|uniref:hypothetical protein n=1 Tax=Pseudomonas sp. W5-36 TaxID=3097455 RepID=UPI00397A0550
MKKIARSSGKQRLARMRPDHERLSFLTVNQTLESMKVMTGWSMSLEDLISQCEEGNCIAYLGGDPLKGLTQAHELEERAMVVFGAGNQRVVSIGRLQGLGPEASASLTLAGPVLSDVPDDYEETVRVWEASVPRAVSMLRFRPTDIYSLAELLVGEPPTIRPLDTREKDSMLKLIAMLVELNGLDSMGHYKLAGILLAEAARLGLPPLSPNTIVTYLRQECLPRDV